MGIAADAEAEQVQDRNGEAAAAIDIDRELAAAGAGDIHVQADRVALVLEAVDDVVQGRGDGIGGNHRIVTEGDGAIARLPLAGIADAGILGGVQRRLHIAVVHDLRILQRYGGAQGVQVADEGGDDGLAGQRRGIQEPGHIGRLLDGLDGGGRLGPGGGDDGADLVDGLPLAVGQAAEGRLPRVEDGRLLLLGVDRGLVELGLVGAGERVDDLAQGGDVEIGEDLVLLQGRGAGLQGLVDPVIGQGVEIEIARTLPVIGQVALGADIQALQRRRAQ